MKYLLKTFKSFSIIQTIWLALFVYANFLLIIYIYLDLTHSIKKANLLYNLGMTFELIF